MVTPAFAAAGVVAPLTEWALKMPVSITTCSSRDFSHLAKVEEQTGLCGLTTVRNSLVSPRGSRFSVFPSYTFSITLSTEVGPQKWEKRILLLVSELWTALPVQPTGRPLSLGLYV